MSMRIVQRIKARAKMRLAERRRKRSGDAIFSLSLIAQHSLPTSPATMMMQRAPCQEQARLTAHSMSSFLQLPTVPRLGQANRDL